MDYRIALLFPLFWIIPSVSSIAQELLFEKEPIRVTISGNINDLLEDRSDEASYHPISLSYYTSDSIKIELNLKAKTRGNFRRKMGDCSYPPLLLNFRNDQHTQNSMFKGQDELKLVTPCRQNELVMREYLLYKIYNQITDHSFKVQLLELVLYDLIKNKYSDPLMAYIIEDEGKMAKRNARNTLKTNGLKPQQTDVKNFLTVAVFEYMISNTDWSVQFRHNIKLISADSLERPICVPYDFDHSGMVKAPYAKPSEALNLSSIYVRRFRGYCVEDISRFSEVIEQFNNVKEDIFAMYINNPRLSNGYKKWAIKFLNKFYLTINDPKKLKTEFSYPCNPRGTGNVVIRGMGD